MNNASDPSKLKMYILIRDKIPLGHQVNCAAHASLACYLKFQNKPHMKDWLDHSFRKVTCLVSDKEFNKASKQPNAVMITESALKGKRVAIAFCPRPEWPAEFEAFKLFGEGI